MKHIYLHILIIFQATNKLYGYENLALRKPSTMKEEHGLYPPRLANDGHKRNYMHTHVGCSHTQDIIYHPSEAWWQVDLEAIYPINTIEITYRRGFVRRFAGFSIFVSNTSDFRTGIECFHDTSRIMPSLLKNWTCIATGRFVTIYNEKNPSIQYPSGYSKYAILELCEVEIYGCPHNKFGLSCGNSCFCSNGTCDYETGVCPGGCDVGFIGEQCSVCNTGRYGSRCELCGQCKSTPCNSVNGTCLGGCKDGWQPPLCSKECAEGYFGSGCVEECGKCMDGESCDKANGTCTNGCAPGYIGDTCQQVCQPGTFGEDCSGRCGKCKENTNCDPTNGNCVYGCREGWRGPQCTKVCNNGKYGTGCRHTCWICKNNAPCNRVTGVCMGGCKPGYVGSRCDKVCERGKHGLNCTGRCGNCYRNEACYHNNGTCPTGCLQGWSPPLCVTCPPGYFGPDCKQLCGNCLNQEVCDQGAGVCKHGCEEGWGGSFCEYKLMYNGTRTSCVDKKTYLLPMILSIVLTVVVILTCSTILHRQRRKLKKSDMMILFSDTKSNIDINSEDEDQRENFYQ